MDLGPRIWSLVRDSCKEHEKYVRMRYFSNENAIFTVFHVFFLFLIQLTIVLWQVSMSIKC